LYLTFKIIIILTLKKRGYKKETTSYSNRNIKAMLNNIKFILSIMDNKWNFISKHYNETYGL
jgi:hypothetical protein